MFGLFEIDSNIMRILSANSLGVNITTCLTYFARVGVPVPHLKLPAYW